MIWGSGVSGISSPSPEPCRTRGRRRRRQVAHLLDPAAPALLQAHVAGGAAELFGGLADATATRTSGRLSTLAIPVPRLHSSSRCVQRYRGRGRSLSREPSQHRRISRKHDGGRLRHDTPAVRAGRAPPPHAQQSAAELRRGHLEDLVILIERGRSVEDTDDEDRTARVLEILAAALKTTWNPAPLPADASGTAKAWPTMWTLASPRSRSAASPGRQRPRARFSTGREHNLVAALQTGPPNPAARENEPSRAYQRHELTCIPDRPLPYPAHYLPRSAASPAMQEATAE